jgi:hypothetical protein
MDNNYIEKISPFNIVTVSEEKTLVNIAALNYACTIIQAKGKELKKIIMSERLFEIFKEQPAEDLNDVMPDDNHIWTMEVVLDDIGKNVLILSDVEDPQYSSLITL